MEACYRAVGLLGECWYEKAAYKFVAYSYNEYARWGERTERASSAIRKKLKELYSTHEDAGGPTCPYDICFAKRLARDIENALEAGGLNHNNPRKNDGDTSDDDHNCACVLKDSAGHEEYAGSVTSQPEAAESKVLIAATQDPNI
jgi:hypothetical protein